MTKPLLPTFDRITPYLRQIDANRYYSNNGPLNIEYERRLSELFKAPCVTGSSATSLLTATLIALNLPPRSLIACPSWTFVATPASIVAAGHVPYFVDVDPSGYIRPYFHSLTGAMIVVAPFGRPVNTAYWDHFAQEFNTRIVIDAAAGFDAFSTIHTPKSCPVIISTHATKAFGTGEGGFVSSLDQPLLDNIRSICNFGLTADKNASHHGINGKLSEYHAAIGLAELDGWPDKRQRYLDALALYNITYATSVIPVTTGEGRAPNYGCHTLEVYKDFPRTSLRNTEKLIATTTFLPIGIEP